MAKKLTNVHSLAPSRVYVPFAATQRTAAEGAYRPKRLLRIVGVIVAVIGLVWLAVAKSAAAREEQVMDLAEPPDSELLVWADELAWAGEPLHVAVEPLYPVKAVYLSLPEVSNTRVRLHLNELTGLYEGKIEVPLELPLDQITVRVLARDRSSRPTQHEFVLPVTFDGC